jgi:hypothetical protein
VEDQGKKGFTVTDRRVKADDSDQAGAQASKTTTPPQARPEPERDPEFDPACSAPMPGMNFASFIISLNTSALIHLGLLQDPAGGESERQVDLARQTIDLLDILKAKTKGNLTREESDLLDNVLFDLRIKFLDTCK